MFKLFFKFIKIITICSKSQKWNDVFNGCGFLNCIENYKVIDANYMKCYKNCLNQKQYNNICQNCGTKYIKIYNDVNLYSSYTDCFQAEEGFYYYRNGSEILLEKCYLRCKLCVIGGNRTYNNCTICNDKYKFGLIMPEFLNCYISNKIQSYNYIQNKTEIENIKENLVNHYNRLDRFYEEDNEVELENILITLTKTSNQKNNINSNKTTIDLGKCEELLKNEYNISQNESLVILKIDIKVEGMKIPKIEYEVYYPLYNESLEQLNLTICQGIKLDITSFGQSR